MRSMWYAGEVVAALDVHHMKERKKPSQKDLHESRAPPPKNIHEPSFWKLILLPVLALLVALIGMFYATK